MLDLIELYQKYCPYTITDNIQKLEFTFDIELLRREIFRFIVNNKFGFSTVSLRLPQDQNNYSSINEKLETGAIDAFDYHFDTILPDNLTPNLEYLQWHPDLTDSYVASLVPEIEKLCGLNIGRIRLGWLQPGHGYPIHCDLEPMRLHIPLFTNNLAYIIHDHKLYNMQYGKLYHLITTEIHTAWNFGRLPRLHLIFSTYADATLDKEINKLTEKTIREQNFIDSIKGQGVDIYSLSTILKLEEYSNNNKLDQIQNIKKIIELLK